MDKRRVSSEIISRYCTDFNFAIVSAGFSAPKTALPVTNMSAPALIISPAFSNEIPPSTSILAEEPELLINALNSLIFRMDWWINHCPPKPGFTLITKATSMSLIMSCKRNTGVAGLIATPAFIPSDFIC